MQKLPFALCLAFLLLFLSCMEGPARKIPEKAPENPVMPEVSVFNTDELFSGKITDGFVWPLKKTDKEQAVLATAKGFVVYVGNGGPEKGKSIHIEHQYIENARLYTVYSIYSNLAEVNVEQGDNVDKQQAIGRASHKAVLFEVAEDTAFERLLKNPDTVLYTHAKEFVKNHAATMLPAKEAFLLIAIKHEYKMQSFRYGKLLKTYDIALSQSPLGHKQAEGDNKLPEGEYRIIQKTKGPFAGDYAEYLGPRFMRLNYPNNYDAENALKNKKITAKQAQQIISANKAKKEPNKHTGIGGGIGIHGWAGDWPTDSKHLTWGCISMKNAELTELFDDIPLYTQILIFP